MMIVVGPVAVHTVRTVLYLAPGAIEFVRLMTTPSETAAEASQLSTAIEGRYREGKPQPYLVEEMRC